MGRKIAGTKFITLIFVIFSILSAIAIIRSEPITDILEIISADKKSLITTASNVNTPSIPKTATEDSITPKPSEEVSTIAVIPSIKDF